MLAISEIRQQFPSLEKTDEGRVRTYLDNPAGTQVPRQVIQRTVDYYQNCNANSGGAFATAQLSDAIKADARKAMAELLNAPAAEEIIFGPNMTTLTYSVSRALGRQLQSGDEIIVTRMDHDANVFPWVQLAEDRGVNIRFLPFNRESFRFDLPDLQKLLSRRTRIVALCHASNAIGTINDIASMAQMAHDVGAMVYVDAVQSTPHIPIDVQALGCDFLACSSYKFFGPHQGILWGKKEIMDQLESYQVRPARDSIPGKFETGTQSHESMAGVLGALEYLAAVGESMGGEFHGDFKNYQGRKRYLHAAMKAIQHYEYDLSKKLIEGLKAIPGVSIHGISEPENFFWRVPTVSITLTGWHPEEAARNLASHNIFVWSGHYYAVEVIEHLGLSKSGGMIRIGIAHYNTYQEIDRILGVLEDMVK